MLPNRTPELLAYASLIIRETAKAFGVSHSAILGIGRPQNLANARITAMALLREKTDLTLEEIATIFTNRHHTSVIHAVNRFPKIESTPHTADITQTIRTALALPKELSKTSVTSHVFSHSFLKSNLLHISTSSQSLSL